MNQLNHEENQFLDRLADRSLPEPDRASCEAILAHATAGIPKDKPASVQRPVSSDRRLRYQQLAASILAASAVLVVLGIAWWSMSPPNAPTFPQEQKVANVPVKKTPSPEVIAEDLLDPMAFDDTYGRLAVSSTQRKINAFWDNDPWRESPPVNLVDQHLSAVRYRIEQLKKRSDFDEFFKTEPEKNEGGQSDVLETYHYVWFDTPWYLFDRDA